MEKGVRLCTLDIMKVCKHSFKKFDLLKNHFPELVYNAFLHGIICIIKKFPKIFCRWRTYADFLWEIVAEAVH